MHFNKRYKKRFFIILSKISPNQIIKYLRYKHSFSTESIVSYLHCIVKMYPITITHLDSNSVPDLFHNISADLSHITGFFIIFEVFIIILLSTLWGIYLILKLVSMFKIHKLVVSTTPDYGKSRESKYQMNKNKNLLLLGICMCEFVLMFNIILQVLIGKSLEFGQKPSLSIHNIQYVGYNQVHANKYLTFRVINSLSLTSFLSILILVRITTQYLHSHYSYFEEYFRLKHKSIYFCSASAVIFGLGIFSYSILIQSILYPFLLITEYVVYIRTSIKLNTCLYKRYFDSQHHEYREKWVTNYYRKVHRSFKMTSITIAIFISCHVIVFIILSIAPQVYVLESLLPNPSYILHIFIRYLVDFTNVIISTSTTIGSVFFIFPYIIFSLGQLYIRLKEKYHFRYKNLYSNPSLITRLIQRQNAAYQRNHYFN